jgi:hypothetical protein
MLLPQWALSPPLTCDCLSKELQRVVSYAEGDSELDQTIKYIWSSSGQVGTFEDRNAELVVYGALHTSAYNRRWFETDEVKISFRRTHEDLTNAKELQSCRGTESA